MNTTDASRLHPGAFVRCPRCGRPHAVSSAHAEGTDFTTRMLYFACRGARFYAGQVRPTSRHHLR